MSENAVVGLLLVATLAAAGACGLADEAGVALSVDALVADPAAFHAWERLEVAETLASMQLSKQQATALKTWADTDGRAIREAIEAENHERGVLAPNLIRAADALLREKAGSAAAQETILNREIGKERVRQEMARSAAENVLPSPMDAEFAEREKTLRPLVAGLTDRQQLVACGTWQEASKDVAALLMTPEADKNDLGARRGAVARSVAGRCGQHDASSGKLTEKLDAMLKQAPTGQADQRGVDELLARLFDAAPAADAQAQVDRATATLASVLSLAPASDLLALVPQATEPSL
jgi:hypothetical protein